jgi:hypothetical protein
MAESKRRHGRLYYLLVFLVLFILLYSFVVKGIVGLLIVDLTLVGILISAVVGLKQTRRSLVISLALGIPWVVVVFADLFLVKDRTLYLATTMSGMPFLMYVTSVVYRHVLRAKTVTGDTISGSICVYLLLGIVWASGYRFLEALNPGSFSGPMGIDPVTGLETPTYVYFSFTTLTTLGYGDITPVTAPAKAVAILEAIVGPLYIAILISTLVSKFVSRKMAEELRDRD